MSKRFLKYISCLAIVCVLLTTIAVPAYAYVKCGYKLKGSWYDDHYYGNTAQKRSEQEWRKSDIIYLWINR